MRRLCSRGAHRLQARAGAGAGRARGGIPAGARRSPALQRCLALLALTPLSFSLPHSVTFTVVDKLGRRHVLRGLEGQSVVDVVQQNGETLGEDGEASVQYYFSKKLQRTNHASMLACSRPGHAACPQLWGLWVTPRWAAS